MSAIDTPASDTAAPSPSPGARTIPSPEEQAAFSGLLEDLTRRHAPRGALEEHWVRRMAMAMLRQDWADALERRVVEAALSGEPSPALPPASLLPRWRARLEKDLRHAACELEASKARRREAAETAPLARIDRRAAAFEAELARDPRAALDRLMTGPDPFAGHGTNDPEPSAGFSPRGTNDPEPPPRALNRAQRRRMVARKRAA